MGSIPGSGRSPGIGNGNPLQYSFLGNPTERSLLSIRLHRGGHDWRNLAHTCTLHAKIPFIDCLSFSLSLSHPSAVLSRITSLHKAKQPPKTQQNPQSRKIPKSLAIEFLSQNLLLGKLKLRQPLNLKMHTACLRRIHNIWNSCTWSWMERRSFRNQHPVLCGKNLFPHKSLMAWTKDGKVLSLEDHH